MSRRDAPADRNGHAVPTDLATEQRYVARLYERLDTLRVETVALRDRYIRDSDNTPGGRVERDIAYARHAASLVALTAAEDRLCFGRLDFTDGDRAYIGRMGIFDDRGDHQQLLMDWRAPSARPFYVATAAAPLGVQRRRHLRTRRRVVESLADEYLDVSDLDQADLARVTAADPTSDGPLLAALNAPRTGRMGDIVETIQAEQDRIIRADHRGVMVVQGGPGTGKTVVALHRAAYLLYTHREQLMHRGVLVVGPNETFLRYISQVLPSLGENAVVLTTPGELFPGVRATALDDPAVAAIKGRTSMAAVLANAVLDRQRMPREPITVPFGGAPGGALTADRALLERAQQRAWHSRLPHNQARRLFLRSVLDQLLRQLVERLEQGRVRAGGESGDRLVFTQDDRDSLRRELATDPAVAAALSRVWPALSPQQVLSELYASPRRLRFAAPDFTDRQRALLERPVAEHLSDTVWTVSDVPLLDEAAELLGDVPDAARGQQDRERAERTAYAQEVLDLMDTSPDGEGEGLAGMLGIVSAADLAERQEELVSLTSTAERAGSDREWTFGHVIVDEAQELSSMAWRVLMRRNPLRSMTLVGDLAQTSDPAGAASWQKVLRPYVRDRWHLEPLTVNYRTPEEIMAVAARVLSRIDPRLQAPTSVRATGVRPWRRAVTDPAGLVPAVVRAVTDEAEQLGERQLAVLVPDDLVGPVRRALATALPAATTAPGTDLPPQVSVLSVRQAKGLEFDVVVVVEPGRMVQASQRGWNDLYVAVTRATQQLGVVHTGRVLAELAELEPR
ncbi:AAA family ATPase [Nakamurella sp. YIM 132084]|uniref:AAA family ATPase n=1 Tax=Nakamurella leprariae TaxID=2803911 RepID=A0A939C348_9ACTN|nr:AAA family ATPase [Nakamurella leprariae]